MALAAGTRLGPYEILGALGAGGMGEVYRARDSRLGRDVAVKVLPADESAGPDRLTRFEQEARAAGALNHPNLLTVFDTGRHDGAPYIVFELLEGETLRERLHRGKVPLRKAIEWAAQIAHGLAAAHERGIVHRDLKPENVFLTADGRIKILDFGLAKLRGDTVGAAATDTPPRGALPIRARSRLRARSHVGRLGPGRGCSRAGHWSVSVGARPGFCGRGGCSRHRRLRRRRQARLRAGEGGRRKASSFLQAGHLPARHRRRGAVHAGRRQTIVYSAAWAGAPMEVFTTRAASPEARAFGIAPAALLAVSATGEMAVALHWRPSGPQGWGPGTLARLSLSGGAPREMAEGVRYADWSPDGRNLAVSRFAAGRNQVEFPVGKPLYEPDANIGVAQMRHSPHGDRLALVEGINNAFMVSVLDSAGKRTVLTKGWSRVLGLAWSTSGEEIWFTGARSGSVRELHAVSLNGDERLVARFPGNVTLHDVSPDGRVLMAQDGVRREIVGLPPREAKERDLSWLDYSWPLDLSPDGKTLLFSESGEGGKGELYLRGTDGSLPVRLGAVGIFGALSPDGKWALSSGLGRVPIRLELIPTGAGEATACPLNGIEPNGPSGSPTDNAS